MSRKVASNKRAVIAFLVFLTISAIVPGTLLAADSKPQQAGADKELTVYDGFNREWLDPAKWAAVIPSCWNALECVRQAQEGKLRLAVRNFGNSDSDTDINWSESEVFFLNQDSVLSIMADVTLQHYDGVGCPTNDSDNTHTQVQMGGAFFNSGSGDRFDDVTGLLILWVDTSNPKMIDVGGWWGWENQGYWNFIASYPVGTPLTGAIKWDKTNHQFIASVKGKGEPFKSVLMPYSLPEARSAVSGNKSLSASVHTLNCTSVQTHGEVKASYDNVFINH